MRRSLIAGLRWPWTFAHYRAQRQLCKECSTANKSVGAHTHTHGPAAPPLSGWPLAACPAAPAAPFLSCCYCLLHAARPPARGQVRVHACAVCMCMHAHTRTLKNNPSSSGACHRP
eukprot:1161902-Pelagomonas_calceolata.AAC.19